tara:strand:- start:1016 stop:1279 length:264 start_codon:yes stop_codon:yes gene_type:complete
MKEFLLFLLSFSDILFIPLIFGFVLSLILEVTTQKPEFVSFRKFMWKQNLMFNFIWLVCWITLAVVYSRESGSVDSFGDSTILWRNP